MAFFVCTNCGEITTLERPTQFMPKAYVLLGIGVFQASGGGVLLAVLNSELASIPVSSSFPPLHPLLYAHRVY